MMKRIQVGNQCTTPRLTLLHQSCISQQHKQCNTKPLQCLNKSPKGSSCMILHLKLKMIQGNMVCRCLHLMPLKQCCRVLLHRCCILLIQSPLCRSQQNMECNCKNLTWSCTVQEHSCCNWEIQIPRRTAQLHRLCRKRILSCLQRSQQSMEYMRPALT